METLTFNTLKGKMTAAILSFEDFRNKKIKAEKKALDSEIYKSILKNIQHLTTKNPKEGSDGKEENTTG